MKKILVTFVTFAAPTGFSAQKNMVKEAISKLPTEGRPYLISYFSYFEGPMLKHCHVKMVKFTFPKEWHGDLVVETAKIEAAFDQIMKKSEGAIESVRMYQEEYGEGL